MVNTSRLVVTVAEGRRQTVGVYMRSLANDLGLMEKLIGSKLDANFHMKKMSDLFQQQSKRLKDVNAYYNQRMEEIKKQLKNK